MHHALADRRPAGSQGVNFGDGFGLVLGEVLLVQCSPCSCPCTFSTRCDPPKGELVSSVLWLNGRAEGRGRANRRGLEDLSPSYTSFVAPRTTMSFLRALPRTAARSALPALRQQTARRSYSSAPEAAKGGNNALIFGLVAAGLIGGGAFYAFNGSSDDPTKIKDAASPAQVDYQA